MSENKLNEEKTSVDNKEIVKSEEDINTKDVSPNNTKRKHTCFFAIPAIILILIGSVILVGNHFGFSNLSNNFFDFSNKLFGNELSQNQSVEEINPTVSKIKVYSNQSLAVDPGKITPSNLKSADNSYNAEGGANTLYDGDPSTCSGSGNAWTTLDAGELKSLAYIRYIPNTSSQMMTNTCVGTKFLASKDNTHFVELGIVEPDANGDLNMDWHAVEFSGYGEFRYFKVELSYYASFGEIEWVCNDGIIADKNDKTTIDLMAFDAAENFSGTVTLGVYNKNKILKVYKKIDASFLVGEYTPIEFSDIPMELGDYISIITYDSATMTPAVDMPLDYRFTESSSDLKMANVYSDNMMLQADEDVIISGKAPCGSLVKAELENLDNGEVFTGTDIAQDVSNWEIGFGSFNNGGKYKLTVTAEDEKLEFNNITFGDVWIFAGQSNMEFYLCGEKNGEDLLNTKEGQRSSTTSDIRIMNMYNIGLNGANGEIDHVPLNAWNDYWAEMTTDRVSYLSAVSYYFAQGLKQRYNRNVGIISVAVGDTEINQWYPRGEENGTFKGDSGKLYNDRIYPFTKLKVKGILWYQGEADQYRTNMGYEEYSDAMSGLVNSYRDKWNDVNLPFYYVQLVRYAPKDFTEIREGQRVAMQKVKSNKNLGFISLLDIIGRYEQDSGCARIDIHPWQKEEVAERFLDYVGHDLYGDVDAKTTGPIYQSMIKDGNKIILTFKHTGSLKIMDKSRYADSVCSEKITQSGTDTNVLHEFKISDEDGKFYQANAEIENDKVVIWSDNVQNPKDVSYAFGAYPEMPNLTDDTGLPAFTFNTANGSELN